MKNKPGFYTPCDCGRFKPRRSGQEVIDYTETPRRYREGTGQIVCKRCGQHEPESVLDAKRLHQRVVGREKRVSEATELFAALNPKQQEDVIQLMREHLR